MRLTTTLAFDAAYPPTSSRAMRYLHGHIYHLKVPVNAGQPDRLGMVIDFDDLKCWSRRRSLTAETTLPCSEPRTRSLAQVQAEAPEKGLPSGIVLERAVIRETPMCSAEINRDRA